MTAMSTKADDLVKALAPVVRDMLVAEIERFAAVDARKKQARPEAEIMAACKSIAIAVDRLEQARFAGAPEIPARKSLHRAARHLRTVMQRHGRMG